MAEIAKSGTPSVSTIIAGGNKQMIVASGLKAGEAIAAGDACYIASTGKVMKSTGAAANAAAKVDGWAAMAASSGEAVTLLIDVEFRYGAGLTPGARYFLSGTVAGGIADAASTGGTGHIATAIDATRIRVFAGRY